MALFKHQEMLVDQVIDDIRTMLELPNMNKKLQDKIMSTLSTKLKEQAQPLFEALDFDSTVLANAIALSIDHYSLAEQGKTKSTIFDSNAWPQALQALPSNANLSMGLHRSYDSQKLSAAVKKGLTIALEQKQVSIKSDWDKQLVIDLFSVLDKDDETLDRQILGTNGSNGFLPNKDLQALLKETAFNLLPDILTDAKAALDHRPLSQQQKDLIECLKTAKPVDGRDRSMEAFHGRSNLSKHYASKVQKNFNAAFKEVVGSLIMQASTPEVHDLLVDVDTNTSTFKQEFVGQIRRALGIPRGNARSSGGSGSLWNTYQEKLNILSKQDDKALESTQGRDMSSLAGRRVLQDFPKTGLGLTSVIKSYQAKVKQQGIKPANDSDTPNLKADNNSLKIVNIRKQLEAVTQVVSKVAKQPKIR